VLSGVLHSFLASGRAGVPFQPVPVPALGLSESDKQCIRDRSCIMARHILADQPEEYVQAQVNIRFRSHVILEITSDNFLFSQNIYCLLSRHLTRMVEYLVCLQ
jgi:hypothetical protein